MNARSRSVLVLSVCAALLAGVVPLTAGAAAPPAATAAGVQAASVLPSSTPDTVNGWVPDGIVQHMTTAPDGTVYFAGEFNHVGPLTGPGAMLATSTSEAAKPWPFIKGSPTWGVEAVVEDGAGGYFVGGTFSEVGGVQRANLAHILASGSLDPAWSADVTSTGTPRVLALARVGTTLYVGGEFESVGGQARSNAAAVSCTNGAVLAWNPRADGRVACIVADGSRVFLGGGFMSVHDDYRTGLAEVGASTGEPTAWTCVSDGQITALSLLGDRLFAAGYFETIGATSRHYLASVSATTGVVDPTWNPGADMSAGYVRGLAAAGTTLYVGGTFTRIAGAERDFLASLSISDASTGTATSWDPTPSSWVYGLRLRGSTLYACGLFTAVAGSERTRAASFDLASGTPALTAFDGRADDAVNVVDAGGTTVYLGGTFDSAGMKDRRYLASLGPDGTLNGWKPDPSGAVHDLTYGGNTLYAAGSFTNIAGQPRTYLAAFAGTGTITPWAPTPNSVARAVLYHNGKVYAGGSFSNIGGRNAQGLAEIQVSPATDTVSAWEPSLTGGTEGVTSLAASGATIYAAGDFTAAWDAVGPVTRNQLAAFKTTTIAPEPWDPQMSRSGGSEYVQSLAVIGSRVYVGGLFDTIGGASRTNLGAVSAIGTGTADATFVPDPNLSVTGLYACADGLYACGNFTMIGGDARRYAALLDPVTGDAAGWSLTPDNMARAFARTSNRLAVGGYFSTLEDNAMSLPRLARFAAPPLVSPPSPTSITIKTTATSVRTGAIPILSGAVTPLGMIGRNIVVWVKKPGRAYFSYSSNRTVYNLGGKAVWQYKYYFKPGMVKGYYVFKASAPAPGFASSAGFLTSNSPTTVTIRLR